MDQGDARAQARRVIERRLAWERAAFFGLLAAFLVALALDPAPSDVGLVALLVLASIVALVGAGYDGAREAVRDLDMIAGLLERDGPGARIEKIPFMMRGHYEIWFDSPGTVGPRRFGLSFANSLLRGARHSVYVVTVPVPADLAQSLQWVEPLDSLDEKVIAGAGREKSVSIYLRRPRGTRGTWQVRLFVRPGRPLSPETLHELRQRACAVAEAVARDGPRAISWGTRERFRPPDRPAAGGPGSVPLREK